MYSNQTQRREERRATQSFQSELEPTVRWPVKLDPSLRNSAFFASLRLSGFHFNCIVPLKHPNEFIGWSLLSEILPQM